MTEQNLYSSVWVKFRCLACLVIQCKGYGYHVPIGRQTIWCTWVREGPHTIALQKVEVGK